MPQGNTSSANLPVSFHWRSTRVTIKSGLANNLVAAILRRVPAGYTEPAITVTDSLSLFADVPNVLGYGMVQVYGSEPDTMQRIDLRILRGSIKLYPGDKVVLQVVSNSSSSGQTYSFLTEYAIAY